MYGKLGRTIQITGACANIKLEKKKLVQPTLQRVAVWAILGCGIVILKKNVSGEYKMEMNFKLRPQISQTI